MIDRREFLKIAGLAAAWPPGTVRAAAAGVVVNDVHSQLNPTRVNRVVEPATLDGVRDAIRAARKERRVVCIAGGRHAMGAQAFATDGVLVDTRRLDRVLSLDPKRGLVEVESGIQWPALLGELHERQREAETMWTFAQKQTGADRLTIGGCVAANIHGRGLELPPFAADVEAFTLLDARGHLRRCSREENPELFSLVIGGYGLFGFVHTVTLRLVPRRKVQRVVQVREVDGLSRAFEGRIRDGFLFGDFQYSIDRDSDAFLRRGVFSCYRPVGAETPIPQERRELAEKDWIDLLHLAHAAKARAFDRYAGYYLSTDGQVYWSDEHQMSIYPDNYHQALDRRMQADVKATEAITEIYCERDTLEPFMADVREDALRNGTDIIYGTVRLIERDRDSFLAWAKKNYACVIFNLHVVHSPEGMRRAADAFRRLIDMGLRHGGSYYPTYHKYATRRQVEACFPQFAEFLKLKRKHDPGEVFQSDWYRHYRRMFG